MCDGTQLGVSVAASASFDKINCVKFNAAKCRRQNREHATGVGTKNKLYIYLYIKKNSDKLCGMRCGRKMSVCLIINCNEVWATGEEERRKTGKFVTDHMRKETGKMP